MLCADLDTIPAGQSPWSEGSGGAAREALHRALREAVATALTERQKALVEGYFFAGLSQGDLARELGIAQQVVQKALFGTVRRGKRVGGALSKLRAALAPLVEATPHVKVSRHLGATPHLRATPHLGATGHLATGHLATDHLGATPRLVER